MKSIIAALCILFTLSVSAGTDKAEINKDSLLQVVNEKIDLAVSYIEDHQKLINRFEDGLLLIMLDKHFAVGMNDLLPTYKEKANDAYMRLYGKYYADNSNFNFPPEQENEEETLEEAMASLAKTMDTAYNRVIIGSFCHRLDLPEEVFKFIQQHSGKSDTHLLQMYRVMVDFALGKCGPAGIASNYKDQIARTLISKLSDKGFSLNNKVQALALLQYGDNIKSDDPAFSSYVSLVTDSQDKDGYWETEEGKVSGPDMHTTIYGLWALLEMREALSAK